MRMADPADLIRLLAHELRQPLSTIESIAYYLTLIDEKNREHLDHIQKLVEQSNWMLNSAQLIADNLSPKLEPLDLDALLSQLDLADIDTSRAPCRTQADPALLRAVIENLAMLFRQLAARPTLRVADTALEFHSPATGHRSEHSLGPGATLSLHGVRRAAESWGGSMETSIHPDEGIKVRVMLT